MTTKIEILDDFDGQISRAYGIESAVSNLIRNWDQKSAAGTLSLLLDHIEKLEDVRRHLGDVLEGGEEPEPDPAIAVAEQFVIAEKAYEEALNRRANSEKLGREASDEVRAAADAAMDADEVARRALFRAEPTSVLGVAALLEALAYNDEGDSPIEMHINSGACEPVNDFMRELAAVLRQASS
jgi:hypothetical protein